MKFIKTLIFLILSFLLFSDLSQAEASESSLNELLKQNQVILSLDSGDLDGDLTREVVILLPRQIKIFTWFHNGELQEWPSIQLPRHFQAKRIRFLPGQNQFVVNGFQKDRVFSFAYKYQNLKVKKVQEWPALVFSYDQNSKVYWQDYFGQGRWAKKIYDFNTQTQKKTLAFEFKTGLSSNEYALFNLNPLGPLWLAVTTSGHVVQFNAQGQSQLKSVLTVGGAPLVHEWSGLDPLGVKNKKWMPIFPQILMQNESYYMARNEALLGQRVGARPEIKFSNVALWKQSNFNWTEEKQFARWPGAILDWCQVTTPQGETKILISFVSGQGQILTLQKVQSIVTLFHM